MTEDVQGFLARYKEQAKAEILEALGLALENPEATAMDETKKGWVNWFHRKSHQ